MSEKEKSGKSAQKEDGYVAIANRLVEEFARINLSGAEWRILWAIFRKTYGWNRRCDSIPIAQFSKMTGMDRGTINRTIRKLKSRNMLLIDGTDYTTKYGLQKDFKQWKVEAKQPLDKIVIDCTKVEAKQPLASRGYIAPRGRGYTAPSLGPKLEAIQPLSKDSYKTNGLNHVPNLENLKNRFLDKFFSWKAKIEIEFLQPNTQASLNSILEKRGYDYMVKIVDSMESERIKTNPISAFLFYATNNISPSSKAKTLLSVDQAWGLISDRKPDCPSPSEFGDLKFGQAVARNWTMISANKEKFYEFYETETRKSKLIGFNQAWDLTRSIMQKGELPIPEAYGDEKFGDEVIRAWDLVCSRREVFFKKLYDQWIKIGGAL